jgi:hypothetical protein
VAPGALKTDNMLGSIEMRQYDEPTISATHPMGRK